MKKGPILFLVFLLVFSLSFFIASNSQLIMEKLSDTFANLKNLSFDSPLPNDESNALDENKEEPSKNTNEQMKDEPIKESNSSKKETTFSKYFPSKEGTQIIFKGDVKYGSSIDTVQYIKDNKIQFLTVCGNRTQTVLEFTNDGVFLINEKEMKDDEIPSNIMANSNESIPLIKGPLTLGTKWTDKKENSYEITAIDKPCTTKAGDFPSI
ncbi:MAG: hypothetical protein ACRC2K_09805, partial [Clostridium sp.]